MTAKNIKIWMNLCSVDYFPNYLFVSFFLRSSSQRTVCDVVLIKTKKKTNHNFASHLRALISVFFWSESHVCVCEYIFVVVAVVFVGFTHFILINQTMDIK